MLIKFLDLNLWEGGVMLDEALGFIKSEQPDIVNLQEVYSGDDLTWDRRYRSLDILKIELGYPYNFFAPAFLEIKEFGKPESGNLILSKFPIASTKVTYYDVPYRERIENLQSVPITPRNLQHAIIKVGGLELNVFNTHGIWGVDGEDNERRLAMGKVIADTVKNFQNVILSGDFNIKENTQTIAQIEVCLVNVFKNQLTTTFNMKHKVDTGSFAKSVVDMVFVSKNLKVKNHICPEVDVSDHLPLVVSIEV